MALRHSLIPCSFRAAGSRRQTRRVCFRPRALFGNDRAEKAEREVSELKSKLAQSEALADEFAARSNNASENEGKLKKELKMTNERLREAEKDARVEIHSVSLHS